MNPQKISKVVHNPKKTYRHIRDRFHPLYLVDCFSLALTSRYPIGTHVLNREWDLLIILDTCRVDAIRTVAPEYSFIDSIDQIWSRAGSSPDWIAHTFDRDYEAIIQDTAYLTANPHAETVLDDQKYIPNKHSPAATRFYRCGQWNQVTPSTLGRFERIWKYQSDDKTGGLGEHTPPRVITDRGIDVMRNHNFDNVILHYMQPHYPYISNAIEEGRELRTYERNPRQLKKVGKQKVYQAYLDDLRYVLDDIELLITNVNAENVVISADHGDAFGEWRMFGHDPGRIHPKVRYVPWVETSAEDRDTYTPSTEMVKEKSQSTEEQLRALGYKK